MKSSSYFQIAVALVLFIHASVCSAYPEYASAESKRVIEAMVEAHGGLEKWQAVPSIRFDNVMHNNYAGRNEFAWWVAHEVIDQKTRRVWQDWPMDDARIGYDGEQVWSQNWRKGNPAAFMVHFFYYFVNLPWLTQDDGVSLAEPARFVWPESDVELYEVRMTFDRAPGVGKSGKDFFVLYIHPETYRLVAYQYGNGYKPLVDLMNMPAGHSGQTEPTGVGVGGGRDVLAITGTASYPASDLSFVGPVRIAKLAFEVRFFMPDGEQVEQ